MVADSTGFPSEQKKSVSFIWACFCTWYLLMLFWPSGLDINKINLPLRQLALFFGFLVSLLAFHFKFAGAMESPGQPRGRRAVSVHFQGNGWNKDLDRKTSVVFSSHWSRGSTSALREDSALAMSDWSRNPAF